MSTKKLTPEPNFWGFFPLLVIYQVLLLGAGFFYLINRLLRRKEVPGIGQRLGFYSQDIVERLKHFDRPVWLHAVSVGEVMAAHSLVEEMRRKFPEKNWVITTTTSTGQKIAERLVREGQDILLYLPWDLWPGVRRACRLINPSLFLVLETELWPTLFHELHRNQVPLIVVNGRISIKAYSRYLWIRPFLKQVLSFVSLFLTQSPQDARRYAAIGAPQDRIVVTGNVKWDLNGTTDGSEENLRELLGLKKDSLLWTSGSTHPGEEKLLLDVYSHLKKKWPNLRLLLAARHPERTAEIEKEIREAGLTSIRRSQLNSRHPQKQDEAAVILLDTMGELTSLYAVSDIVFVGGSLVPHGGHNLVEPASFERPILTGPHLHNFQTIAESLHAAGGVAIVQTAEELEQRIEQLLEKPALRQELGHRAAGVIREHRGATARTVKLILLRWHNFTRTSGHPSGAGPAPLAALCSWLAFCAAALYRSGLRVIYFLYNKGILKTHRLPAATISIGNLTWGGTGKTPLVIYVARLLEKEGHRAAVLTRGYGRDESQLLTERLRPIPVIVGPDRVATARQAVNEFHAQVLVLDDGYQQWRLKKDVEILTIDATNPFGNGHLLPQGILREPLQAASRADLIIVTKSNLAVDHLDDIEADLRQINSTAPIFRTTLSPTRIFRWPAGETSAVDSMNGQKVCTLAGIAHPQQFEQTVEGLGAFIALKYRVRDHHPYTAGELIRLFTRCRRHGIRSIVTTAKDAVRIPDMLQEMMKKDLKDMELLVLDVAVEFEKKDENEFHHRIRSLLDRPRDK